MHHTRHNNIKRKKDTVLVFSFWSKETFHRSCPEDFFHVSLAGIGHMLFIFKSNIVKGNGITQLVKTNDLGLSEF